MKDKSQNQSSCFVNFYKYSAFKIKYNLYSNLNLCSTVHLAYVRAQSFHMQLQRWNTILYSRKVFYGILEMTTNMNSNPAYSSLLQHYAAQPFNWGLASTMMLQLLRAWPNSMPWCSRSVIRCCLHAEYVG